MRPGPGPGLVEATAVSVAALDRIVSGGVALTTEALARAEPGYEITLQQWRVLRLLAERTEPMSVSAVAATLGVTLPATSRQLHRLESRGLIQFTEHPRDRRSLQVGVTAAGESLRAAVLAFRRRRLVDIIERLELSPGIERALAEVADALQSPADRAPVPSAAVESVTA